MDGVGGGGQSSGNGIKRQFETPITPGTGGKAMDASSGGGGGSQIISEGGLGRSTSARPGTNGPAYDEYRQSPFQPPYPTSNGYHSRSSQPPSGNGGHRSSAVKKTILRRKCAWKNYPELEAFLISNREEYLRHSAMNYTVQQKQYNNRLTERLLEVAANHNYVFDENDFNFVAVRDRIRCYYKSYVQSSKKRGIIVGYSAQQQATTQPQAKKLKVSPENSKEDNYNVGVGEGEAVRVEEEASMNKTTATTTTATNNINNSSKEQTETKEQSVNNERMVQQHVNTIPESKSSSDDSSTSPPLPSTTSIAV